MSILHFLSIVVGQCYNYEMYVTGLYDGYGIVKHREPQMKFTCHFFSFSFKHLVLSIFPYAALHVNKQGVLHQALRHYVPNDQIFILLLFRFIP